MNCVRGSAVLLQVAVFLCTTWFLLLAQHNQTEIQFGNSVLGLASYHLFMTDDGSCATCFQKKLNLRLNGSHSVYEEQKKFLSA